MLSSRTDPCPAVKEFLCQLKILELPESRPILTAGYEAVLHIHTTTEEVTIVQLVSEINRKTGKSNPRPPTFVKSGAILVCKIELSQSVCMETFGDRPRLARFSLRDEGRWKYGVRQ